MSYAAAMAADRARLDAAKKRNMDTAALHGDDEDHVQGAWDDVLHMGSQRAAESEEEARRRKQQKKAEKRASKKAAEASSASNLSIYVSGIPPELSFNAVQNLFGKAGKVTRCKLYKDASGENKGDGIVTFANEAGLQAALERDDWDLFGDILTVTKAAFTEKEQTPKEDWSRVVVLKQMFSQEEIGAAADYRAFVTQLEEEVWRECARLGAVEQIACFPADMACAVVVRFAEAACAAECIAAFDGRWFNERAVAAEQYDGNRKRTLPVDVDEERQARLVPVVPEPPAQAQAAAAGAAAGPDLAAVAGAAAAAVAASGAAAPSTVDPAAAAAAAAAAALAAAREQVVTLPPKTYVKLFGLKAGAQHNGKVCVVESYDEGSERYTVKLQDGAKLAPRLSSMLQMLPVRLTGLAQAGGEHAAHDGAAGTLFDYDAESHMYGVELDGSGDALPVSAEHVVLPDGAVASIRGLQSAPQHNGALARVLSHDAESGRYLVQLGPVFDPTGALHTEARQLRLKRQNLRA